MKKIVFILLSFVYLVASDATIEIIKRVDKLPTIQLQDASDSYVDNNFREKFFKILIGDLKVTTYFDVIDTYTISSFDDNLRANADVKADFVLRYKLFLQPDDSILATVKLINPNKGILISTRNFRISKQDFYPFLAHSVTIDISKDLGTASLDWMGKYIIFSRYTSAKSSEIVVADYTLTYQKVIVKGGLNIFPKWANKEQSSFFYTTYNLKKPTLFKVSLLTGEKEFIINSDGMLAVSDVSKNEKDILITMAYDDQPDIFLYNIYSKKLEKQTSFRGVDVSGNFVDDESGIVFVSDRLGYPNIFYKKFGSNLVEQMVYHGRNNGSASSYKNYIVYSSRDKLSEYGSQTFNLYLISTKTDFIRQITATGKNIFPRFSNDGESILFIKEYEKQSALGLIRLGANKSFYFPLKTGKIQSLDW